MMIQFGQTSATICTTSSSSSSMSGSSSVSSRRAFSPCASWCSGSRRERARKSVVPVAFWFFSIGGGLLLLVYALYRRDPVFIAGQALGLLVYVRNLYFIIVERTAGRRPTGLSGLCRACEKGARRYGGRRGSIFVSPLGRRNSWHFATIRELGKENSKISIDCERLR